VRRHPVAFRPHADRDLAICPPLAANRLRQERPAANAHRPRERKSQSRRGRRRMGIRVIFHPLFDIGEMKFTPNGMSNRNGEFSLGTYKAGDGAPVGEYPRDNRLANRRKRRRRSLRRPLCKQGKTLQTGHRERRRKSTPDIRPEKTINKSRARQRGRGIWRFGRGTTANCRNA